MQKTSWAVRSGIVVVTCAAVAACSGGRSSGSAADTTASATSTTSSTTTTTTAAGEAAAPLTETLSDDNILGLISEANNAEIQAAQMALTKASNSRVRAFAQRMIRDHREMQAEGDKVAKQISATPTPPPVDSLAQHIQQEQAQLGALSKGLDFDRAYINDQVTDHQTVLAMLKQFQTMAQHDELKTLLTKAIPKVQTHLDAGQQVQSSMASTA